MTVKRCLLLRKILYHKTSEEKRNVLYIECIYTLIIIYYTLLYIIHYYTLYTIVILYIIHYYTLYIIIHYTLLYIMHYTVH